MNDRPKVLKGPLRGFEYHALIQCPACGRKAWIDRDQFEGKVSILCEDDCGYHETHDFRAALDQPEEQEDE